MDSVTQLVLGASVGHAVAGKSAGRKAMVAGAIGGTIPDLDIVFYPFLDSIQQLGFHRGISHSFFFVVLASPLFGWIAHKISGRSDVRVTTWAFLGFWALLTHILLDAMTVYGTGLFEPFSRYRAAFNAVFIIDPAYTVPMLICLLPAAFAMRNRGFARRLNIVGLTISTLYLGWALVAKSEADSAFKRALQQQDVEFTRLITMPTPFNTLLWRAVVETDDGFLESYYSVVAEETPGFRFVPQRHALLDPLTETKAVETVIWFSRGFYTVDRQGDRTIMYDLRFGRTGFDDQPFVFTFEILPGEAGPGTVINQVPPTFQDSGRVLGELWKMIIGRT